MRSYIRGPYKNYKIEEKMEAVRMFHQEKKTIT
jgi:hypothetical protein